MKKYYGIFAALFIVGIIVGLFSAKIIGGTYALEEKQETPVTSPKRVKDKPRENNTYAEPRGQKDSSGGSGEPDNKESPPLEKNRVPEEPLGEIRSWWFKRNNQHLTPVVEDVYVHELAGKGYFVGDTSKKNIYLTFDEGYENGNTPEILDILKANNVKAAFFVTGKYIEDEPELVKRMVREGHLVGNHTDTHPSMPEISNEKIRLELEGVAEKFRSLTGQSMRYLRPPKGEYNPRTLKVSKLLGYETIFWSMAYRDWDTKNQPGHEVAHQHVMDNIHNGAIILLHAVSDSNTAALDRIIKDLKNEGYIFSTLDDL